MACSGCVLRRTRRDPVCKRVASVSWRVLAECSSAAAVACARRLATSRAFATADACGFVTGRFLRHTNQIEPRHFARGCRGTPVPHATSCSSRWLHLDAVQHRFVSRTPSQVQPHHKCWSESDLTKAPKSTSIRSLIARYDDKDASLRLGSELDTAREAKMTGRLPKLELKRNYPPARTHNNPPGHHAARRRR